MAHNIKMIAVVIFGVIALYIFQIKHGDHNLNKSISACIVAQKKTSESFDPVKAKNFCKEKVKKMIKD